MNENPFKKEYWFGTVDPRPLAIFRVLFGSVVFVDYLSRVPDVRILLSDEGLAPRASLSSAGTGFGWSVFQFVGSPSAVLLLYLAGVLALAALAAGYRTRLAQVAGFVFVTSVAGRNPAFVAGPDRFIEVMSFFLMFTDSGAVWSVDWLLGGRPSRVVLALGMRLLQWQLALVCFFASQGKWSSWGNGFGIYRIAQYRGWVTPLGDALLAWPAVCVALNWLVLGTELAVPLLLIPLSAFSPWFRAAGILLGAALFTGMLCVIPVGSYPEVMLASLAVFLLPQWLGRAGLPSGAEAALEVTGGRRRLERVLGLVAAAQLAVALWSLVATRSGIPEGSLIHEELAQLHLDQRWKMFVHLMPQNVRWTDRGTLADGSQRDVLAAVLPKLLAPSPEVRWLEVRDVLPGSESLLDAVTGYACREFNRGSTVPLVELDLELHIQRLVDPGADAQPEQLAHVFRQFCEHPQP